MILLKPKAKERKLRKDNKLKATPNKLDDLWSKIIKMKVNGCEYCGKTKGLNAHHIFSRSNYSTRWNTDNGICLCSGCHVLSSKFSAHKTPAEFVEWVKEYKGDVWYQSLRRQAKTAYKPDYEWIMSELKAIEFILIGD